MEIVLPRFKKNEGNRKRSNISEQQSSNFDFFIIWTIINDLTFRLEINNLISVDRKLKLLNEKKKSK